MNELANPVAHPSKRYPETTDRNPVGIIDHYCEHPGCKKWGAFGFARGGKGISKWFCYEHREYGERFL
ncbi:hypothetical protein [Mesorhizobium sp. ZC-5]|uniref:hypothetical protein n=1 Tax=Mesorhizobium sp. ZC-5 TaxID=2986066 RepID=UPI0021E893D0|nr:hypothetical protein [Mesorhizobium sp. ZC-5]MCV3243470.1 hypothetical protein [Mesorhizobium sp. ZC-5]